MNALEEFLGKTEQSAEEGRRWSTNYVRQDAVAVAGLLAAGVTMGEPEPPNESACTMCWWHIENTVTGASDGSSASALLGNLEQGYYGEAKDLVLHPVLPR